MNILRGTLTVTGFSKWRLTERMLAQSKLPEKIFVDLFKQTAAQIEEVSGCRIPRNVKKKILPALSAPYLKRLKASMIAEAFNSVLGNFNHNQLLMINEEMDKTGENINLDLRIHIVMRFFKSQGRIEQNVRQKAGELSDQLMYDTLNELSKEGIDIR
jgi:hypothetical protein